MARVWMEVSGINAPLGSGWRREEGERDAK